jgi:hypothetical protein
VRKAIYFLAALPALAFVSCDRNSNLYPVSGQVFCNGVPASGAAVFFYRQGGDSTKEETIMGIVQPDGSFELVTGALGKGAPPGEYDVLIEWKPVTGQNKGRPERSRDRLEGRFADRKHPLLHATVAATATILPPFELADAGPAQQK